MTVLVDLAPLEDTVQRALATNDHSGLHVVGYGEITPVLAFPEPDGPWACKRLPVFRTDVRLDAYRERFDDYITGLSEQGVVVQPSRVEVLPVATGTIAYIVQPAIDPDRLGPTLLRDSDESGGRALLTEIVDHINAVVSPTFGFDAQLSNWARIDGELVYFDVSTPMLRDTDGNDLLDTELFIATLPAVIRPVVRHFLLSSVLDQFFVARASALDFVANLHKERLGDWVPIAATVANERLALERPITVDEARRYFRRNQRTWAMIQAMRKADRVWHQHVRRRPYKFLLPGRLHRSL